MCGLHVPCSYTCARGGGVPDRPRARGAAWLRRSLSPRPEAIRLRLDLDLDYFPQGTQSQTNVALPTLNPFDLTGIKDDLCDDRRSQRGNRKTRSVVPSLHHRKEGWPSDQKIAKHPLSARPGWFSDDNQRKTTPVAPSRLLRDIFDVATTPPAGRGLRASFPSHSHTSPKKFTPHYHPALRFAPLQIRANSVSVILIARSSAT